MGTPTVNESLSRGIRQLSREVGLVIPSTASNHATPSPIYRPVTYRRVLVLHRRAGTESGRLAAKEPRTRQDRRRVIPHSQGAQRGKRSKLNDYQGRDCFRTEQGHFENFSRQEEQLLVRK